MANKRPKTRAALKRSEADQGNAVYLLALDMLDRLATDRDEYQRRAYAADTQLHSARERLTRLEQQLEASRLAAKVAEDERAQFEAERDEYAGRLLAIEEKQRVNGFLEGP